MYGGVYDDRKYIFRDGDEEMMLWGSIESEYVSLI